MVNNTFLFLYALFVNLLFLPASWVTYKYSKAYPDDFEANPVFAKIFKSISTEIGLIFRHLWLFFFLFLYAYVFIQLTIFALFAPIIVALFDSLYDIFAYIQDPIFRKKAEPSDPKRKISF